MKKISKLLAVVLAVAMLICPAMCLTSMAETQANGYTVTYADDVLTVNVTSEAGFLVSLIKIDVEGYAIDEENIAVTTVEGINFSANPSYENGVLTLLLASKEAANVHLVTGATVTIPAVKDEGASKYYIALTKIQAADAGTATAPESFIDFDGVNTETGAVETVVPTVNETSGPAVDPALVFYKTSLAYGTSSLELNFRIANTVLDLYSDVEVVIIPQKYDMTTLNLVANPTEIVIKKGNLAAAGSKYKQYTYKDIQLYELGLNIDYMLRAYDAEGNLAAVSETYTTSAAGYLKTTFAGSSDAKLRTLITDTLIVGQESVNMMKASYPDSDLAKAASIIAGFDTSEATPSLGTCNTVDTFNSYNSAYGTANTATHQVRKSVSIGKAPFLAIRTKDAKSALDLSKISYRVTYTSLNLNGTTSAYNKTFTNASTKSGQFITFNFEEIGLGDGDKDILIEVLYNGKKVCDLTYSMETYLGGMTSNASVGGVCTALLKLGAAFRAYATK